MKILVLGGTQFVGRNFIATCLRDGHQVSLLHRGITHANLFPDARHFIGDRADISNLLPAESWDLVVDFSGYHPEVVNLSSRKLSGSCGLYVFISTISVYQDLSVIGITEDSPLLELKESLPPPNAPRNLNTYGALKALCEQEVTKEMTQNPYLIIRPGVICGPYDKSERMSVWIRRFLQNNSIQVPDDSNAPIQFLDVHALSEFILQLDRSKDSGIVNVTGPSERMGFLDFIYLCQETFNHEVKLDLISPADILTKDLWQNFPMYYPRQYWGGFDISCQRAVSKGFKTFPALKTISAIADFLKQEIH